LAPSRARILVAIVLLLPAAVMAGRQSAVSHQALPFTVISQDGRRPLAATQSGDHTMVGLDDLASLFQLTVREDTLAGGLTVSYKGKAIVLTPGQALTSAAGRLIALPTPPSRDGRRWLVPVEFISRALGLIYDARLDVRKNARFVLVGDVRVPHITVRQEQLGPQTRVTFTLAPRTTYTVSQEPTRVLVKFDVDALDIALPAPAAVGLVQSVRAVDPTGTVAIDVAARFGSFRTSLVPQDEGAQVIVDLMPGPDAAPAPVPRGGVPTLPVQPAPEPPPPSPAAGALRTIVIDPGHGGDEAGAKGGSGTVEKDVTLAVARKLKAVIEARLGVRVLLTRDADQAVPLDERAALANNNKADLFVSLHANGSLRKETSGAQIYYLSADQAGDAARSAVGRQTLPALGGGSRDVEMVLWEFAQVAHVRESAALAGALEEQMRGRVRLSTRSVQQAPFRVLAGANMPAVLIEMGFLTNPDEELQLASDVYQGTLAQAILDGLLRFRELSDAARPPIAPVPLLPERRQP
jgi:N-acetylmuramoyl-L-alanine amidase